MKSFISMLLLLSYLFGCSLCFGETQPRPGYLDEPVQVRVMGEVKPGEKYPLIVFLPFTGGNADIYFRDVSRSVPLDTYLAVIPRGTTLPEHYLPDFMSFIRWYEQRLLADLQKIMKEYPVDAGRIYLSGYSLGGDLAWALTIRHKEMIAGAVVLGSRCSYVPSSKDLKYLREHKNRFVLLMGTDDLPERVAGMANSSKMAERNGLTSWYRTFSGGHIVPVNGEMATAHNLLLGNGNPTSTASTVRPAAAPPPAAASRPAGAARPAAIVPAAASQPATAAKPAADFPPAQRTPALPAAAAPAAAPPAPVVPEPVEQMEYLQKH